MEHKFRWFENMRHYLSYSVAVELLFTIILSSSSGRGQSPFCSDPGCKATRATFKQLCDYINTEKSAGPAVVREGKAVTAIFITGYYMRTLVAGYEILGDQRYLDTAIAYSDTLLKLQNPQGYWLTGYGGIELADTGSAVGLFAVLYKHVDKERQRNYVAAMQRYVDAIEKDGLILPSGALGYGWATNCASHSPSHCAPNGGPESEQMMAVRRGPYVTASCLTGGEMFTWMYLMTKQDKYRRVAYNSLRWVLSTMSKEGVIPYVADEDGIFLNKPNDPDNNFLLWDRLPYLNSDYLGEGLLSFDLHCDQPEWKADLRKQIKPHIEWLLRNQNANGSWGVRNPRDQSECSSVFDPTRTPGIANFLIWYYEQVEKDPRIVTAVRKFDRFLQDREQAKAFGLLNAGHPQTGGCLGWDAFTSLAGYALTDILVPGLSSNWDSEWQPGS